MADLKSNVSGLTPRVSKEDNKPQIRSNPSPLVSLGAGAIAGSVEAAITYPFEFAKTRAQLREQSVSANPISLLRQVVRDGGVRAVYVGSESLVLGAAGKASVRFLTFDSIKNVLSDSQGHLSFGRGIIAGMAAGVVESVTAVTPTERIKTALSKKSISIDDAKQRKRFRGGFHAAKVLIQENGFAELYRGLASTTMKQGGTSAVRMGSYNVIKQTAQSKGVPQNPATSFAMGAMAGTITVYTTQPLDTLKTRSQSAKGSSSREAFVEVLRDSGIRGFWKGSTMRLSRLVFSGGIIFTVYEQVVQILS